MKMKIKVATIARIGALVVAIANEILAFLGKDALPFTENMAYQVISLVFTIVVAAINCWYNQDVSQPALICGKIFDAMKDGNLSEKEIEAIVSKDMHERATKKENHQMVLDYCHGSRGTDPFPSAACKHLCQDTFIRGT